MRRFRGITYWTLGLVPGLATVVLGAGLVWLRGSLPELEGKIALPTLEQPAEVLRDGDGIVTIRAGGELDAARVLGFVHAQDRLWQMDFMRRAGAGRLSEVAGAATLGVDRLMRGLGLYRLAEASLEQLAPETRALIEAYAEGVNAFLAEPGGPLPPEFQVLGYEPEPWRPADSLVWGRLMAFQLSNNWWDEVRRLQLAGRLSPAQIAFLWPETAPDAPVTLSSSPGQWRESRARSTTPSTAPTAPPFATPRRTETLGEAIPWSWAPKDASNVWVLAGARTATGLPILANDPHLPLEAPGQWYLARIETPELTLAGATAPGVPFMMAGRNGAIAWGFTTTHADTQDLFIERQSRGKPEYYDTPTGPQPFSVREEVFAVRDQAPETLLVRETRHGPVLSDLRPELAEILPEGQVLALAWPALRADDRGADALYRLNRARGWPDFLAAMALFHSPVQNIAYADKTGGVGFLTGGRIPLRKAGDGRTPVPGWSGDYDWTGFIPFAELPMAKDPTSGLLINANNRVVDGAYPHLISADWPDPYRAMRIRGVLESVDEATVDDSLALQQDVVSLGTPGLLSQLLRTPLPETDRAVSARALLAKWRYDMTRDRPEPLIFHAWLTALNRAVFSDELGPIYPRFHRIDTDLLVSVLTTGDVWCDDITTRETETCERQVHAAFTAALAELEDRFGPDIEDWRWGEAHMARFPHPVLRHVPLLGGWVEYAVEADGGFYTVNRGGPRIGGPPESRYENRHGAGFRAVYDLADLDNSRFMIATGQSGNPLSPYYGNLVDRWRDGEYVKLDGRGAAPLYRLRLDPG